MSHDGDLRMPQCSGTVDIVDNAYVHYEIENEKLNQNSETRIKKIFDKYDVDGNGILDSTETKTFLKQNSQTKDLAAPLTKNLISTYDANNDRGLNLSEMRQVVRQKSWILKRYCSVVAPLPDKEDLSQDITFCPPPFGILIISIIQMAGFILHKSQERQQNTPQNIATGFSHAALYYSPQSRQQFYRFFTYMFVHANGLHIASNLFVQIFLGIPLEYVHSWWRVMIVYLAGVFSGSLGASIVNADRCLVGASAGGYALLFAYIPTFFLNWNDMKDRVLYFTMFVVCFTFITMPLLITENNSVSHVAHVCGAVAGILVGMVVLKNIRVEPYEKMLQRLALLTFVCLLISGIVIHLVFPNRFESTSKC